MTETGSKRKLNVVAQGLDNIVLDPGTIAGYRSKCHRISEFLTKNGHLELVKPNTIHPSKSIKRPKAFMMPCCEKLDIEWIGIIFDWIACDEEVREAYRGKRIYNSDKRL